MWLSVGPQYYTTALAEVTSRSLCRTRAQSKDTLQYMHISKNVKTAIQLQETDRQMVHTFREPWNERSGLILLVQGPVALKGQIPGHRNGVPGRSDNPAYSNHWITPGAECLPQTDSQEQQQHCHGLRSRCAIKWLQNSGFMTRNQV